MTDYQNILIETPVEHVGLIRLNRPKALNALNNTLMSELHQALSAFDQDEDIACMVITGNERAFAAGADIKEMADLSYVDQLKAGSVSDNFDFSRYKKPIIAAVSGYVLGGGCEMAMACDMIVASESAVFGQPEINLGILPGGGGTQRMTRALGKALAMEVMLTDRKLSAEEALHYGLVNRVVAPEVYLDEALKLAQKVASMSQIAIQLTKDAINKAYEATLSEGLEFEKKNFFLAFGTEDKREGMSAFVEKRKPKWQHK
ncbi:MAG: enoyl-CoA hydratase-related protein [Anaerolineae bacterium]